MTVREIELHDTQTAPRSAQHVLASAEERNGFVPNVFRALSNSPSTLNGFAAFMEANDAGSLSPIERQIVQLVASIENRAAYCVAGHSAFASAMGLSHEPIDSLRDGRVLSDPRQQALAEFTRAIMRRRGDVPDQDIADFLAAGFRTEHMLEVIAGVALKVVTNYTGIVFRLTLDDQFATHAWPAAA